MPRAAIDIGSNSVLLLVTDDVGAILHDEARVVGLGRGLGDRGLMAPDRLEAAQAALADYVATAGRLGVEPWQIKAVATSAARTIGSELGRQVLRGVLGSILGGSKRR